MDLGQARRTIVTIMKQVGFVVVESTEDNPNPLIHDEHDFEVWVEYKADDGTIGKEALYFSMTIEDNGRVNLYWWDFTHTTLICAIDRTRNAVRIGMQKLYCGEFDPVPEAA